MLKKFSISLFAGIVMLGICTNVLAVDTKTTTSKINETTVTWEYELNDSDQIENLKCTNPTALTGNITLPSTLDGKTVISLKNESFKGANITGLVIPNTLKSIGYGSFSNCANLSNVNLGQVEKISFDVFKNCPKLTTVTIPKTLITGTIAGGVFTGTTKLTSVTFENGITEIPAGILRDCTSITKVTIPSSVTKINEYAFQNSGLTEITIPNSIKEIEYNAFQDCEKLEKVTILNENAKMGWYSSQPTEDSVFGNHNENLTIYCYEGSTAAKYAISNNIKYVYLTKPTTDSNTEEKEEQNQQQKPSSETPNNNQNPTEENDKTTATGELPQTGVAMTSLFVFLITSIASITFYMKYRKFRDIK